MFDALGVYVYRRYQFVYEKKKKTFQRVVCDLVAIKKKERNENMNL